MPPRRRDEIQAQIDALTAELDSSDDGTELWVKDAQGRETKLTGAHAKKWLKQLGLEDDEAQDDGAEGGDGEGQDPPPRGGDSVWGRKSR